MLLLQQEKTVKLRRIETPGIAHYAYVLASESVAAVIDPSRDPNPYLDAVREWGVRITHIVETHRQEDFVMGSAHLAGLTGAAVVNGDFDTFGRGDLRLHDGEAFELGELTIRALHTPGHTPESMSYVVCKSDVDRPWCVFTGDALFYGTTGRTDLSDADRAVENAGLLHDSVHGQFGCLPDTTLVLPAHGPGSVCGSGMDERPYSTIGEEKARNEVFTLSREKFAEKKGGERIPRPPYFRNMERVNLEGGLEPDASSLAVPLLAADSFARRSEGKRVFDTREPEGFAGGHIAGCRSIWLGGVPVFGGWMADAETPVFLVTDRTDDVKTAAEHLSRIGIDRVEGALKDGFGTWRQSGRPLEMCGTITPHTLSEQRDRFEVIDVREPGEFADGHIPGARNVYVGYLAERVEDLSIDPAQPVVVTCGVGHRAGLGVSILLDAGFSDVRNLLGGMTAWQALGLELA